MCPNDNLSFNEFIQLRDNLIIINYDVWFYIILVSSIWANIKTMY